jgi:ABC-type uncharacterized transport system substrate-binding protein
VIRFWILEFELSMAAKRHGLRTIAVCVLLLALGYPADAQQIRETRIAVVGAPEEPRFSEVVAGLRNGLGELGYAPQSLIIQETRIPRAEEKSAKTKFEDLLRWRARVLFLIGSRLLKPVREVSAEVPVVFITPGDPLAAGLVTSLARPGGNTTAITFEYPELSGKRLELLREIAPQVRRVLAVYDPRDPSPRQGIAAPSALMIFAGPRFIWTEFSKAQSPPICPWNSRRNLSL